MSENHSTFMWKWRDITEPLEVRHETLHVQYWQLIDMAVD